MPTLRITVLHCIKEKQNIVTITLQGLKINSNNYNDEIQTLREDTTMFLALPLHPLMGNSASTGSIIACFSCLFDYSYDNRGNDEGSTSQTVGVRISGELVDNADSMVLTYAMSHKNF